MVIALINICPMDAQSQEVLVSRLSNDAGQNNPNIEIAQRIAERLGANLKLIRTPFKRALIMMKKGNLDILAGLLRNPEREEYIFYIQPPYKKRSDTVFFVPKGQADTIKKYENLFSLKIGLTIGAKYFPKFDRDQILIKEAVPDGQISFRKLLAGRIQTVISSEGDGIDLADKMGISTQIEMAKFRFKKKKNVYIGLSKASKIRERIPDIESTIGSMIESGEIIRVFENYYSDRNLPVPIF